MRSALDIFRVWVTGALAEVLTRRVLRDANNHRGRGPSVLTLALVIAPRLWHGGDTLHGALAMYRRPTRHELAWLAFRVTGLAWSLWWLPRDLRAARGTP